MASSTASDGVSEEQTGKKSKKTKSQGEFDCFASGEVKWHQRAVPREEQGCFPALDDGCEPCWSSASMAALAL